MNFLRSRSRRSSRVSSKNNSAEQNNRLKKPSKSEANATSRTDESSTDQASLELLPHCPSLASTSNTNNNKPSQSKANLTTSYSLKNIHSGISKKQQKQTKTVVSTSFF